MKLLLISTIIFYLCPEQNWTSFESWVPSSCLWG